MIVSLPPDLGSKLQRELRRAGTREIGGVLVGEHVGNGEFRIADISIQRSGGTASCFVRQPAMHQHFLQKFYRRTGCFERFNYLGEWHSHPSFSLQPSMVDRRQMQMIVESGDSAALFALLMITRLDGRGELAASAKVFAAGQRPAAVTLVSRDRPDNDPARPYPILSLSRLREIPFLSKKKKT